MREGAGIRTLVVAFAVAALTACGTDRPADAPASSEAQGAATDGAALGPVDGRDLPGAALERVAVGDVAPDFRLMSYRGDTLTLSENRGERDVVLVFYRGHW